ncbi:MAG: hypothetical protein ACE5DO_01570 [Desulfobacterales bacterium]
MAHVTIVDCGPRVGLSSLPKVRTSDKVALTDRLVKSGITKIDCVAFTHPRLRPEYADAEKVIKALGKKPGATIIGMAPNEIACRRALSTDIDEISTLVSASESFNRSVLGYSVRETLNKTFPTIFQACMEKEKPVRVYIVAAFGCQFEGKVPIRNVVDLTSKLAFMGVNEISLVDTTAVANPKLVKETITALRELNLETKIAVHFHNTRGLGMVNCLAAFESGIRIFDTAIGGLSSTPFGVPKTDIGSWEVSTEDLVYLFNEIGVETGIDSEALFDSAKFIQKLAGRELPGHMLKARNAFERSDLPEPLRLN